jgi:hypothetical protein
MADIVTFNPLTLRIVEIDAAGDNEIDWREIYSEWKDWILADSSRSGYPQMFRVVGGDPVSDTENLGSTFFLMHPWRLRPAENDHRLVINGNLFTDPAGQSPYVPTLGDYTVHIESKVSTLIESVAGGGGGSADDVWQALVAAYEARPETEMGSFIIAQLRTLDDFLQQIQPLIGLVAVTYDSFILSFPEFSEVDQTYIEAKIGEASALNDSSAWGSDLIGNIAVLYYAAHLLCISPYGKQMQLLNDDGHSTYGDHFERRILPLIRRRGQISGGGLT